MATVTTTTTSTTATTTMTTTTSTTTTTATTLKPKHFLKIYCFLKRSRRKSTDDDSKSRRIMKISLVRFTRTKVLSSRIQFSIDLLNRQFCIAKCWDSAYRRDLMRETERTKILFFLLNLNPPGLGRNSRKHTTHHYSTLPSLLLPSN